MQDDVDVCIHMYIGNIPNEFVRVRVYFLSELLFSISTSLFRYEARIMFAELTSENKNQGNVSFVDDYRVIKARLRCDIASDNGKRSKHLYRCLVLNANEENDVTAGSESFF